MSEENAGINASNAVKTRGRPFQRGNKCGPGRGHFSDPAKAEQAAAKAKEVKDLGTLAREHTQEAVEKMVSLMRGGSSHDVQLRAAGLLAERGWGKATQPIDLNQFESQDPRSVCALPQSMLDRLASNDN